MTQSYTVADQKALKLSEPVADQSHIILGANAPFTLLAGRDAFLASIKATQQEYSNIAKDLMELADFVQSSKPASDINFGDYKNESGIVGLATWQFMELAESGSEHLYVFSSADKRYLPEVVLESYSCSGEIGGRRLRTPDSQTVFWTFEWIA